jgi:magnesium-transporting ATPase (P-type)
VKACNIKNLLLRGCTLKNISHCYGICLYVGAQTKIFMNSKKPPRKVSALMQKMNKMLYTVFALQFAIITIFSVLAMSWNKDNTMKTYLDLPSGGGAGTFFI